MAGTNDARRCPECGAPLPEGDDCVACLLRLGLTDGEPRSSEPASDAREPAEIGPYRILRKLGEGGGGVVYLAEQTTPIRREVALKVLKRGLDTRRVIARFEAERQALAMMEHPAIARVFDAGATPRGRPYFVMEHVDGEPITSYCDRHQLRLRERLELFTRVCEGVQHAHHKGIIHRDIKPSNVLVGEVDGRPQPKIIDFGIAKAIEKRLTEETLVTELGVLLGTPEYMSPEQADLSPLDVDTRTDVYSLGLLLYELLLGALPFDPAELRRCGFDEIRRRIRDDVSPTPSARLGSLGADASESARRRRVDLPTLRRELRGDLDWITAKALEKDRARRYDSPAELAADVRRHLESIPVLARPPSAAYQVGRFVRRNKLLVGSLTAVVLALVVGAATATAFAIRESKQRREAEQARADLEKVAGFQARMLASVDAAAMGRRLLDDLRGRGSAALRSAGSSAEESAAAAASFDAFTAKVNSTDAALRIVDEEILARAAATLKEEFGDQPLVEARLQETIGTTYRDLGLLDRAEPHLLRAVELRLSGLGPDDPKTFGAQNNLAILYARKSRFAEAMPLFRSALEGQRRILGDDDDAVLKTLGNLAAATKLAGDLVAGERLLLEAVEKKERKYGKDHESTQNSVLALADLYTTQSRFEEAEPLHRRIVESRTRTLGPEDPRTLGAAHNLVRLFYTQKRYDEAEKLGLEVLEARRRVLGEEHFDTLGSLDAVVVVYIETEKFERASAILDDLIDKKRRVLGEEHPSTLRTIGYSADVLLATGRVDEAAALHERVLDARRRVLGADHPDTLFALDRLARVRQRQGRAQEAAALFAEVERRGGARER